MKKILVFFCLLSIKLNAQVGINTNNPDAALDINSQTEGILIPRIALVDINDPIINSPEESELVYNTTENGRIKPGFYYWYKTHWRPLIDTFQMLEINGDQLTISEGNDITLPAIDASVQTRIIPILDNGWLPYGSNASTPTYYKDRDRVYLAGTLAPGTSPGATIFTLPEGYRPLEVFSFPMPVTESSFARIYVYTDGRVTTTNITVPLLTLDGISFRID